MMIPPLAEFLDTKPIYYKKFDPNRIVGAYQLIVKNIKHPKRIHLIGTNGKGSTGRTIAYLAYKSGFSVGHFSSPHILHFSERFWINGTFANENELQEAHEKLYNLLGEKVAKSLSYFEYQTLLAFVLFENCNLQVIEAGLGGEYDATSVAKYDATIFTPIGFDHQPFLGDTINSIATTKLKAMDGINFLAPQIYKGVQEIALNLAKEKNLDLFLLKKKDLTPFLQKIPNNTWPFFIKENIATALFAMKKLQIPFHFNDLKSLKLFGRFYRFKKNIILDVGHNALAAKAIKKALKEKVVLIFNILDDKDAKEVLITLKEKIKRVEIIPIQTQRTSSIEFLKNLLDELKIEYCKFQKLKKEENYLVFGSFYVVESFLKKLGVKSIDASKTI